MNLSQTSIQTLRKSGYKVRCLHYRYSIAALVEDYQLRPQKEIRGQNRYCKGGLTQVEVTTPEGLNYKGEARCHINDNFNRKLGIKIALGRLEPAQDGVETE